MHALSAPETKNSYALLYVTDTYTLAIMLVSLLSLFVVPTHAALPFDLYIANGNGTHYGNPFDGPCLSDEHVIKDAGGSIVSAIMYAAFLCLMFCHVNPPVCSPVRPWPPEMSDRQALNHVSEYAHRLHGISYYKFCVFLCFMYFFVHKRYYTDLFSKQNSI